MKRWWSTYDSKYSECTSSPSNFSTLEVPITRFGYDNVSRKTIEVCSNSDSITFVGTSSADSYTTITRYK